MNSTTDPMATANIPMPRLSDDAVVQIHDFIHHVLDLFEARYGDPLRRFYEDLCVDCMFEPDTKHTEHHSPF